MKRYLKLLLVFLFVIGVCGSVDAALIGSLTDDGWFSSNSIFNTVDFDIHTIDSSSVTSVRLFDSLMVSPSDVGKEFFATSSVGPSPDPEFDVFVSVFTNGEDDNISVLLQMTLII